MAAAQGGSVELDRAQVENADRIREQQRLAAKRATRRRHGNNGARQWGKQQDDPWEWHDGQR